MATAKVAPAETEKKTKNKKINQMTLEEIEKKLQVVQQTQGGLNSLYARHLLRRREVLLAMKKDKGKA
ncbi:MAG: hypothetical protein N3B16_10925 [Candidatus Aminicenantes bacterium]|nr:hypothetical protein [Candidatus Aminicenantes bacterium]